MARLPLWLWLWTLLRSPYLSVRQTTIPCRLLADGRRQGETQKVRQTAIRRSQWRGSRKQIGVSISISSLVFVSLRTANDGPSQLVEDTAKHRRYDTSRPRRAELFNAAETVTVAVVCTGRLRDRRLGKLVICSISSIAGNPSPHIIANNFRPKTPLRERLAEAKQHRRWLEFV